MAYANHRNTGSNMAARQLCCHLTLRGVMQAATEFQVRHNPITSALHAQSRCVSVAAHTARSKRVSPSTGEQDVMPPSVRSLPLY